MSKYTRTESCNLRETITTHKQRKTISTNTTSENRLAPNVNRKRKIKENTSLLEGKEKDIHNQRSDLHIQPCPSPETKDETKVKIEVEREADLQIDRGE